LACALGLATAGLAQAATLSLDEAMQLAARQHPSVTVRQNQRSAAAEAVEGARRGLWPSLSAQTGKDALGQDQITLRVEQPVWTGGRLTAEIRSADARLDIADALLHESRQDIMLRAASAYAELGRAQARQAAAASNLAEHVRLHALIQRRIAGQLNSGSDGVLADGRLAQARVELSQWQALGARARAALEQIVGRPVETIESVPRPQGEIGTLDATLDAAFSRSPVLRRLQAEEDNAAAQAKVAQAQALPQVKLRHDQTQGGQQGGGQTYVAMEYQTGAGFNTLTALRQAESLRLAARAEHEAARRDLADTISADWADWQSLNSQAGGLEAQVQASELVYESYARQYAVGRKSWLEVLNAQRELTQSRYLLADVQWGAWRTLLKLQLASGQITASTPPDSSRPERHD
jgi:adhesin transport system outer membrane protein